MSAASPFRDPFSGHSIAPQRYIRFNDKIGRDDEAVMPLYDVNGFIAGRKLAS